MKEFIVDVKVIYAKVQQPDKETGTYALDMIPLDKDEEAKLIAVGLAPAKRQDGTMVSHANLGFEGNVFRAKRKTTLKDGTILPPPIVTDSQSNPITMLLGHGTIARVFGTTYDWKMNGKSGVAAGFNRVQVIDLIPYTGKTVPTIKGGFVASNLPDAIEETKDSII